MLLNFFGNIARKAGLSVANISLILAKVGTKAAKVLFCYILLYVLETIYPKEVRMAVCTRQKDGHQR
jgi:hypothetical protein